MTFPNGPMMEPQELHKEYFLNTFPFLLKCFEEYGDIFSLQLGDFGISDLGANGTWVFLTKSEDIEKLFKADKQVVYGGEANQILFQRLVPTLSSTLLDGEKHLKRRKMILKYLKDVSKNTGTVVATTKEVVTDMAKQDSFSIFTCLKQITYLSIFKSTMGRWGNDEAKQACAGLINLESADTNMEEKRVIIEDIEKYLYIVIKQAREHDYAGDPDTSDTIFEYLLYVKENNDFVLTAEEMAHEMVGLLLGGLATTAVMLSWVFAFVLSDDQILEKIYEELERVCSGEPVNAENVAKLDYINSVIMETLRIQPFMATPGVRLLKQAFEVGGYSLPSGTLVANCSYLLQRRAEYYSEPEKFCPERFADGKASAYEWTPFGGGVRRCVGQVLAMHNMKVIVATILQTVELELAAPLDGAECLGASFGPKGGPRVRVARR